MGIISKIKSKTADFFTDNLSKVEAWGNDIFYGINFTGDAGFWTGDKIAWLKDFSEVPEVMAAINWKARAFSNMQLRVESRKTGEILGGNNRVAKLIIKPNYFQSQKQFLYQTKLFHEIFGNEFIRGSRPIGMSYKSVYGLFTLPYGNIKLKTPRGTVFFNRSEMPEVEIIYRNDSRDIPLVYADIIHLTENAANLGSEDFLLGRSQISGLQAPIKNLRASYEARNVLIENRGALGILTNAATDQSGSVPMKTSEKEDLQKQFKKYGLSKKQYQFILTSLNLKWQQIAVDTDKLKLFEEATEDQIKILDAFGLTKDLFSSIKSATFSNKLEAKKQAYQDTIIPESEIWIDALNRYFKTENESYHIVGTFGHLPVFQTDFKAHSTALRLYVMALSEAFEDAAINIEQYKRELAKYGIETAKTNT